MNALVKQQNNGCDVAVAERVPNPNGIDAFLRQASRNMGAHFASMANKLREVDAENNMLRFRLAAAQQELATPHLRVEVKVTELPVFDTICQRMRRAEAGEAAEINKRVMLESRSAAQAETIGRYQAQFKTYAHDMAEATRELAYRNAVIDARGETVEVQRAMIRQLSAELRARKAATARR